MNEKASDLSVAAIAALHQGNRIEAIKILRQERGVELKEAKEMVDEYLSGQPGLQSKLAAAQAESKRSIMFWFVVLLALAAFLYYFAAK